jgi:signal transduction histidine kinase/PAS domain-containing protein
VTKDAARQARLELALQKQAQRHLAAQYAVSSTLADAHSLADALPRLLEALCTRLKWDLGICWQVDGPAKRLVFWSGWAPDAADAQAYIDGSKDFNFGPHRGVLGIVWATGKPSWRQDIWNDPDYLRSALAKKLGFRESVVVPVLHRDRTLAIIEFVNRTASPADDSLLQTLSTACFQIGLFAERGLAEAKLRDSREHLATMLRSIGDAVLAIDADGNLNFMNRAAENLLACSEARALGQPLDTLLNLHLGQVRQPIRTQDGRQIILELTAAKMPLRGTNEPQGSILVLRDVTQQAWREDTTALLAHANSELATASDDEQLRQRTVNLLVPHFADACLLFLQKGTQGPICLTAVAHVDAKVARQLHSLADQLSPLPLAKAGPASVIRTGTAQFEPDSVHKLFAERPGAPMHQQANELLAVRSLISVPLSAAGRVFGALCMISSRPSLRYEQKHLTLALCLARDIGYALENARLYKETREAIAVRDDFLSLASHELKTPLTPLKLQLQSLERHADELPPKMKHKLRVMADQVVRLEDLVSRLLDVSCPAENIHSSQLTEVNLRSLINKVTDGMADELQRLELSLSIDVPGDLFGCWDSIRVEQVLNNLICNAMRFGAGKPIKIVAEGTSAQICVSVIDQGIGIDLVDQQRIFGRFERAVSIRRFGGFGLGLFICKQIVESLGGRIWVKSIPGEGATFCFCFPRN